MDSRLVEQHIRNHLIEYVGWVCEYADEPEPRLGMNELLNQWEDFITRPICETNFPAPVYTTEEINALSALDVAWDLLCSVTEQDIARDSDAFEKPEWSVFVDRAREAQRIFLRRGKLSEDLLIPRTT